MPLHAPLRMRERSIDSVLGLAIVLALTASLNIAAVAPARAADDSGPKAGPSAESALAAEQELARAMRANDAAGIERLLADDWAVIATTGGVGEGKSIFPDGIKSGYLTRKTFEISEPRVRLYGNIAVVTTKVQTSGTFQGRPFDVSERQTDVLRWQHGAWKVVLTHETKLAPL
jgi:ketosteroid isomerase-like protein